MQLFHLTYNLSSFFFITFSVLNSFCFTFRDYFLWKVPRFSSPLRLLMSKHSIFNFFNHKNFFRTIWSVTFYKNIFIFWCSNNITNFKFRLLLLLLLSISLLQLIYAFDFTSTGFILFALWYVLLYLLIISYNLSIYTFFGTEVMYL